MHIFLFPAFVFIVFLLYSFKYLDPKFPHIQSAFLISPSARALPFGKENCLLIRNSKVNIGERKVGSG